MRDQLIGYLLDALEPGEREQVQAHLERDPQLQRELDLLSYSLLPLAADRNHYEPPLGLADRTCQIVFERTRVLAAPATPYAAPQRQWSMADMVVAAGIFVAAALLFFPAVSQSRFAARVTQCQDNLRRFGMALNTYSEAHGGFYPNVPAEGPCAAAGIVAVKLRDMGLLDSSDLLICPASDLADNPEAFRIPTEQEIYAVRGAQLAEVRKRMGGSLGFNLGFYSNGKYYSPRNLHRVRYAVAADQPSAEAPYHSQNHGGCGQNVLFEDQHVEYLTTCRARGCRDHIYTNDEGVVGPGLHLHDAVIAPSHASPRPSGKQLLEVRAVETP
ncbi:MAG: hypothetical protein AB7O59_03145 [Pirellulales bacterium]